MDQDSSCRYRMTRVSDKDRKKSPVPKLTRTGIGRLDSEAFTRRCNRLREIFLDPQRRHTYEWTILEKKILMLDWYHNPSAYESWKPAETEDMMNRFFSNIIYNYSHLSMVNIGATVIFCRLLDEYKTICKRTYQLAILVLRYCNTDIRVHDELKLALLWRGHENKEVINNYNTTLFSSPKFDDYQCLIDGINFNLHKTSSNGFEISDPCESCSDLHEKTVLSTPKITFTTPILAMETTTALIDNNLNYLVATKMIDYTVRLYDVTSLIASTLQICERWETVHQAYVKSLVDLKSGTDIGTCTGCMFSPTDLEILASINEQAKELNSTTFEYKEFTGLVKPEISTKSVAIKRDTSQTGIKFLYTSIMSEEMVIPTFVAAVGGNVCIWSLNNDSKLPISMMQFPQNAIPTDVSASLAITLNYNTLYDLEWIYPPDIYTTDDDGYLRLWSLNTSNCEAELKLDSNSLLSLDVNKRYPHLIAIGCDSGKIKVYNILKQCLSSFDENNEFLRFMILPSHLSNNVYEFLNWFHPVIKVRWINDVFVYSQYSEPHYTKESTNSSTLAIWNVAKDVFSRDDAFLCNKYWSQNKETTTHSGHLVSRLVCLYGGHFCSVSGVLSSDCLWSKEYGLIAISSDNTGQLHWYKPGIWTWGDCDDSLCIARTTGDVKFHENILNNVQREYDYLHKANPYETSDSQILHSNSSNIRKNRSNYSEYVQIARSQLSLLGEGKSLSNDFNDLPIWCKKTLKISNEEEKFMKIVQKSIKQREIMEHSLLDTPISRPPIV